MDNNKQRGFSLLELMIVLFIIVLLSTGALASYRSFDQTKKLEADADAFVEAIELAKKRTSSGQKPCVGYTGQYRVTWTTTTITLTPRGCSNTFVLNLQGNQFLSSSFVDFNPFGRGTSLSADTCLLLKNIYHDKCRKITIEKSGTVSYVTDNACSCS